VHELRKLTTPSQHDSEPVRRVYLGENAAQFEGSEHCYTMKNSRAAVIEQIDSGEASPLKNRTPVSSGPSAVTPGEFLQVFRAVGGAVDSDVFRFVEHNLKLASNET